MEEKILLKLTQIENKFDKIESKFDEIDKKFDKQSEEMKKMKEELRCEMEQQNTKLAEELRCEMEQQNMKLAEDVKKQILDHMFVFEEQYGRKLTIAFEALTSKYASEEIQDEEIKNLKRISDLNTAYVYNHEDRLDKLEVAQL